MSSKILRQFFAIQTLTHNLLARLATSILWCSRCNWALSKKKGQLYKVWNCTNNTSIKAAVTWAVVMASVIPWRSWNASFISGFLNLMANSNNFCSSANDLWPRASFHLQAAYEVKYNMASVLDLRWFLCQGFQFVLNDFIRGAHSHGRKVDFPNWIISRVQGSQSRLISISHEKKSMVN